MFFEFFFLIHVNYFEGVAYCKLKIFQVVKHLCQIGVGNIQSSLIQSRFSQSRHLTQGGKRAGASTGMSQTVITRLTDELFQPFINTNLYFCSVGRMVREYLLRPPGLESKFSELFSYPKSLCWAHQRYKSKTQNSAKFHCC